MCHGAVCRLITVIGKTLTDVFAAGSTIDATFVKVHSHVSGALGGKQAMAINTKIYAAVDANGIPVKFTVTCGTVADRSQACELISGGHKPNDVLIIREKKPLTCLLSVLQNYTLT